MLRTSLALLILLAACSASDRPAKPPNLCEEAGARCVNAPVRDVVAVDGDTFELQRLDGRVRLRLIGWDSPETGDSAACAAEAALGQQVEERVFSRVLTHFVAPRDFGFVFPIPI